MNESAQQDPRAGIEAPVEGATACVLLVDDHELVRDGLRLLIDKEEGLRVCGEAANELEATQQVEAESPDLVVCDLSLGSGTGLDVIKWIRKHHPKIRIIVSTMHDEKVYGERAFRAGASGYVNKQDPARTIIHAIRRVLAGNLHFSEELLGRMLHRAATSDDRASDSPLDVLSDRELEVFRMIGQGVKTSAIGKKLHLSSSTVETYRERLKTKLGLKNGTELAFRATQWMLENAQG